MSTDMDFNIDHLFTTDHRIIEDQILSSKYKTEIITTVIVEINQHLDDDYFTSYVGCLEDEDYYMYMKYYNSFYKNKKIDKILKKKDKYKDDSVELHNWFTRRYGSYQYERDKKQQLSTA
jgi:hypothetical protein